MADMALAPIGAVYLPSCSRCDAIDLHGMPPAHPMLPVASTRCRTSLDAAIFLPQATLLRPDISPHIAPMPPSGGHASLVYPVRLGRSRRSISPGSGRRPDMD